MTGWCLAGLCKSDISAGPTRQNAAIETKLRELAKAPQNTSPGRSRQSHWPPRSLAGRDPRCVRAAEAATKAYDGLHLTSAPPTAGATRSPTLCSRFCESS